MAILEALYEIDVSTYHVKENKNCQDLADNASLDGTVIHRKDVTDETPLTAICQQSFHLGSCYRGTLRPSSGSK